MTTPLCSARGMTRLFGDVAAVAGVDLDLHAGEVVGLAGPNGAGKSTLARLLTGFLHSTGGEVRLAGEPPARYRLRHGVGYLPEEVPRLWGCRLRELLEARPGARGALGPEEALAGLGIRHLAPSPLPKLSKGQWRLALTAYALLGPSRLIVLDEPDAGLDPAALDHLVRAVRAAADLGAGVLILSHQLHELEAACDRVLFMLAGRIVDSVCPATLPPGAVRARYRELSR